MRSTTDFGHLVCQYLISKGVRPRRQAALIAGVLDVTEAQARRKLQDQSGWYVSQLDRLANHFEEGAISIVQLAEPSLGSGNDFDAILHAKKEVPCRVAISGPWSKDLESLSFVAQRRDQLWHVYHTEDVVLNETGGFHIVASIAFREPVIGYKPSIAVVDDVDASTTATVLELHNFVASPYNDLDQFIAALKINKYDAIVLDWVFSEGHANSYLEQIITITHSKVPILIFTGFALENEIELTLALSSYNNILLLTKPIPHYVLAMNVSKMLNTINPENQ